MTADVRRSSLAPVVSAKEAAVAVAAAAGDVAREGLRAVVIGASAGGVEALRVLLAALPATLGAPVIVVLHIGSEARWAWATVFAGCALEVREAEDKEPARPGMIYVAPPDYHLLLDRSGVLTLSLDEPVHFARPSIDVLFDAAAWALGAGVLGILLTGANEDGARGLAAIHRAGGACWVQAPETAAVDVMPRAGLAAVPQARALSLQQMSEAFQAQHHRGTA